MATTTNGRNSSFDYVCEPFGKMVTGGMIAGGDFTKSTLQVLLVQIVLSNSITAVLKIILKPFVLLTFVPEVLSGIIMGPSILSRNRKFRDKLFLSARGDLMMNALEHVALMFLFFTLTVQVDFINLVQKTTKLSLAIGITIFVLPIIITTLIAWYVRDYMPNQDLQQTLLSIAMLETICSFRTVILILDDLKLLNSELGRTALSSAFIAGTCTIFLGMILIAHGASSNVAKLTFLYHLCRIFMILVIVFILRPILYWMMRQTPEKKPLKEKYICIIILMILGCSLWGEITGLHAFTGPIILGMVTPNSPPMGSTLINRLQSFVWIVLMPCFAINIGKQVNIFNIGFDNFIAVIFIAFVATSARLIGALIPPLYYKMPLKDAFPLGLILSCRGIFDVIYFYGARREKVISNQTFSAMIFITIVHNIIVSPIFRAVYDTSRRYLVYNRRTIQHAKQQTELQIVACIHEIENVSSIINILEVSNSTKESPLNVYVMNLEELVGGLIPLFISHKYDLAPSSKPTRATSIINIFRHYQVKKQGLVNVWCFTSVAHYDTMHDYICTLANDKSTALIIIPFQKSDSRLVRAANQKVLENAPCSVAMFFARGMLTEPRFMNLHCIISVCVIYIGGSDDREALAYATRMAENPRISLTVVRFVDVNKNVSDEVPGIIHDENAIHDFRVITGNNKNVVYKEKKLTKVFDTAKVLQCMENDFDLMVVGRKHDNNSRLLKELSDWVETEELGVIGDAFVSSDVSRASVLVVQQQALVVEEMLNSP